MKTFKIIPVKQTHSLYQSGIQQNFSKTAQTYITQVSRKNQTNTTAIKNRPKSF